VLFCDHFLGKPHGMIPTFQLGEAPSLYMAVSEQGQIFIACKKVHTTLFFWSRLLWYNPGVFVGIHGFKGSGVQGSILITGLHLGCVFTRKASASSGLIQNLQPKWQLFGKNEYFWRGLRVFNAFFVLNSERWTPWPRPDFTLLNYLDSYLGAWHGP